MEDKNIYYMLGKKDAVAEILMKIRIDGVDKTLESVARELLTIEPEHPHASWYLKSIKTK